MTDTEATGRQTPPRRSRIVLALLAATAALTAGAHALSPAPALALNNQGNQCENLPPWEATNCEMETGGGGDGGGIVGGETIEIHETLSPCQRSPLSCLPSDGRSQHGSGETRPHGPRPGSRPARVAAAPPGNSLPTLGECKKLQAGELTFRTDQEIGRYSDAIAALDRQVQDLILQEEHLRSERSRLERSSAPDPVIDGFTSAIKLLQGKRHPLQFHRFHWSQTFRNLRNRRNDEMAILLWKCKNLYWPVFDD
jgi:hypothetical protein